LGPSNFFYYTSVKDETDFNAISSKVQLHSQKSKKAISFPDTKNQLFKMNSLFPAWAVHSSHCILWLVNI